MKVNKHLIALFVAIICGTGVFAQKSLSIIKPTPEYGGFSLQFKVNQSKGNKYNLEYQYSAIQNFPIPFSLRTDNFKMDTVKTDTTMKLTFTQSNSNLSDPPSQFWLRIKMTDSSGTYYSDTQFVETWAIPKTPWIDTIQGAQNNGGIIESYLKFYSNVQGTLVTYGKFGNSSNIFNFPIDSIKNLNSLDSNGLLNPKVPGIPSGSTFYVAYKLINAGGTSTVNAMKVMPYVVGNQKPTLSKDSCTYTQSTKNLRIRIKSGFFGKTGSIKVYYGTTSGNYTDTLPSQYSNGIGLEYNVWEFTAKAGTTYFFKFVGTSSNGVSELLFSKTTDLDPITTTLVVDTAYGTNLDLNSRTMTVQVKGSFTLGSGITVGEIWGRLSENPNFTLPYNSNSFFTTSTSGQTPALTFNSPVGWDTTKIYYVQLIMLNKSTSEIEVYSKNYKVVYQPRLKTFMVAIDGIQTDVQSKSGTINLKYENTEGSTSTIKMTISQNANMSGGITSPEAFASSSAGSIKFPINNLVAGKNYYIQGAGTNSYGKSSVSAIQSFTLGTNTGIGEIQIPTVSVYPNPATENFTISIPNNENYMFELFDMSGKLVLSKDMQGENSISRDVLPSVIYFYKVGSRTTGKLVFQ
jgi:hypothetical protein